jgi:signal transduction histidine kinase/ligand-binding sensor domain-containing protein/AraC-like DNA-binding protein/ActR/RegA family two-component response regulator
MELHVAKIRIILLGVGSNMFVSFADLLNRFMRKLFFLLVLVTRIISTNAQYKCIFAHYSTNNGLSHGSIGAILRDRQGYIWIGTWDGLNRFDGSAFTVFKSRPGDSNSLSTNRIAFLMEDKWGFIWVKTYDSKIFRFNKQTERFEAVFYTHSGQIAVPVKAEKMEQFSNGDIWVTTQNSGVYRVITDSKDFSFRTEKYSSETKEPKFYDKLVNFVFKDTRGQIWAVTGKGLNCLAPDKENQHYISLGNTFANHDILSRYHFMSYLELNDNVWFGTKEGVVVQYDRKKNMVLEYQVNNTAPIRSIVSNGQDELIYLGTYGNGLIQFDGRKKMVVVHRKDPLLKNIRSLFTDQQKLIWLDTDLNGVVKFDPLTERLKHFKQKSKISTNVKNPCQFYQDEKGVLWISLGGIGFGYYNRMADTFDYFYNDPDDQFKKVSNNVSLFIKDSTGVIWMSTYNQGLEKITFLQEAFKHQRFKREEGNFKSNEVRCIFEDSFKNLWVATRDGTLHMFDMNNQPVRTFTSANSNLNAPVYCMAEDKYGTLFLGTKGDGIFEVRRKSTDPSSVSFIRYNHNSEDKSSLSHNDIYSILKDKSGRVWIGTYGGGLNLMVREGGVVRFVNQDNTLISYPKDIGQKIRHLQEDARGGIWFATTDGLLYFRPESDNPAQYKFSHYGKIPGDIHSLGNDETHYIYRDKTDSLWIGTLGGGLNQVISYPEKDASPRFRNFTRAEGMPSDVVLSITGDQKGNLWLGTGNGLSCFDRKHRIFKNYDEYDGLEKTQFSEAACLLKSNGEIMFGSQNGLYSFSPDSLKSMSPHIGNLVIHSFKVYNKELKASNKDSLAPYYPSRAIELNYDQNVISIEYGVLNSKAPHKIQYAYTLEGFDDQWYQVKNQHVANYIKIPPGKYIFRVKVINEDMIANNGEQQLVVNVLPPPWKTGWAYGCYFLILLGLLEIARRIATSMIQLRNKIIIEHQLSELKMGFFTDVSHELRTPLTLILGPLDEISKNECLTPQGIEHVGLIDKNARRILRLINHILDFRKIEEKKMKLQLTQVELVTFIRNITAHFVAWADEKKIDFCFQTDIVSMVVWVDEEKLDIVIFNLLSNAFKFTPAGKKITISLARISGESSYLISVSDEGIGISGEKLPLLFNRFVSFDQLKNHPQKGTGIGLALSRELISLHKGSLTVNSMEGSGSTFTITMKTGLEHLPADEFVVMAESKVPSQLYTAVGEQPMLTGKMSDSVLADVNAPLLMLVEDQSELRNFLTMQFGRKYRIVEAADGVEGLDKAKEFQPDLIVSDIMMPNMDGIEMLDRLKNDFHTSHIPVILLSAKSSLENQIEGLRYGADAYLTKPFSPELLNLQVENMVRQRRMLIDHLQGEERTVELNPKVLVITSRDEAFLKQVTRIIEENIPNVDFNIEGIASVAGLGRSTFFKKVKGLTGLAPVELVRDFRIKRAAQLLQSGEYSISEIAFLTGFNSAAYFSTCFKEKFLQTPSDYQNKCRQGLSPKN